MLEDSKRRKEQGQQTCAVCTEKDVLHPFFKCTRHAVCQTCLQHAQTCELTCCSFCPVPAATLHLQCPNCAFEFHTDASARFGTSCGNCGSNFVPQLLRIWKRGMHTYTNFLTETERKLLNDDFNSSGGHVHCPSCRLALSRSSACNDLFHCGFERVCACCGQFAFRWERGLSEHRQLTKCAPVVEQDTLVQKIGEEAATAQRVLQTFS